MRGQRVRLRPRRKRDRLHNCVIHTYYTTAYTYPGYVELGHRRVLWAATEAGTVNGSHSSDHAQQQHSGDEEIASIATAISSQRAVHDHCKCYCVRLVDVDVDDDDDVDVCTPTTTTTTTMTAIYVLNVICAICVAHAHAQRTGAQNSRSAAGLPRARAGDSRFTFVLLKLLSLFVVCDELNHTHTTLDGAFMIRAISRACVRRALLDALYFHSLLFVSTAALTHT